MPTATDLVTDLPADFEVFGQAVATSMADLLGGTSGQILAKNSNTDMDFVWIANDQGDITGITAGTGITVTSPTGPVPTVSINTAVTADLTTAQTLTSKTLTSPVLTTPSISNINAKGDILVGTADNTLGVITAGSNGETLVADSSTSTGLRYQATQAAGKNYIINGGMDVWQRGTSFTGTTTAYGPDRFMVNRNTTGSTFSRQTSTQTGFTYAIRCQRDVSTTATNSINLAQNIESLNSVPLAGQTITLSFYAKAGANFSAASSQIAPQIYSGTGTDQNIFTGFTGQATLLSTTATLTTSFQRFSYTATVGSTATELAIIFGFTPVGTAGANDWFEVTGVQLEIGSVATNFTRAGGTIQGELAACQRYFYKATLYQTGFPAGTTDNNRRQWIQFPVTMRTTPSSYSITVDTGTPTADQATTAGFRALSAVGNTTTVAYFGTVEASAEL